MLYRLIIWNDRSINRVANSLYPLQRPREPGTQPHHQQDDRGGVWIEGLAEELWHPQYFFFYPAHLRQANRFYGNIFLQELLPKTHNHIIHQIDNLRSNNSKEALTLVWEFLEHQNIEKIHPDVICPLVDAIFVKSTSEKGFLKSQALRGINTLPKKYNPYLVGELGNLTQSNNGNIA